MPESNSPDAADANPQFTVLLPVTRPPGMLPYSVASVLAQQGASLELFIVCDGAPDETNREAERLASEHGNVRAFVHPKGERHGEAWRHLALQQASGQYVAHICDDDLWFPDHLLELGGLLREVDFGCTLEAGILPDASAVFTTVHDYGRSSHRKRVRDGIWTFAGLSQSGYRLDAYRKLPEGWAPAPPGVPTDHHMWMKFLRCPGLTSGSRFAATVVNLPTPNRRDWTMAQRVEEIRRYHERLQDPASARDLRAELLRSLLAEVADWRDYKTGRRKEGFWRRLLGRPRDV